MKRIRAPISLLFFACIAMIGSWHGFPLVDVFSDETYFAFAPLRALQTGHLLPENLPYGTFTYLLLLPLQACFMGLLWLLALSKSISLESLLFADPFLAYIASRLLNVALYFGMAFIAVRSLRIGKSDEKSYAKTLLIIVLLSAPLLIVAHSGKMWMTSLFLIFAAGISLPTHPLLAVLCASLAFSNFPIMGDFWLITVICACIQKRHVRSELLKIMAIACVVPLVIMLLNPTGIFLQILDILQNFSGILPVQHIVNGTPEIITPLQWWFPVVSFKNFLAKIALSSPFALLAIFGLWGSRIKNPVRFWYGISSAVLYLVVLSIALNPSVSSTGSIRYLSPLVITLLLCITSLEISSSPRRTIFFTILCSFSLFTGIVFVVNLAIPTTYNRAYTKLLSDPTYKNTVIISSVPEISFPYTVEAAEMTMKWMPASCSARCRYALSHPASAPASPTYLLIRSPAMGDEIIATLKNRAIVEVRSHDDLPLRVSVENGAGNYATLAAWWPLGFGKTIHITLDGATTRLP